MAAKRKKKAAVKKDPKGAEAARVDAIAGEILHIEELLEGGGLDPYETIVRKLKLAVLRRRL